MTDKPDTLFERHPRPWTREAATVFDANSKVIGQTISALNQVAIDQIIALINADAPKRFEASYYWYRMPGGSSKLTYIASQAECDRLVNDGATIGPRIEKPEF